MSPRRIIPVVLGIALTMAIALPAVAKPAPVTKIKFKLDSHEVTVGSNVTGTVFVATRSGNQWLPFEGATLSVRVAGVEVGTVTTDATGFAAVSYTAATEGDYAMKVFFLGDDTHKRAQRAQGFSVAAASTTATAPDAPVLSATAGTALVSLSWTAPADGGSPITGYNVYRGTASGGETLLVAGVAGPTYDDTTAVTGTTYYYVVTAVNAVGESVWSNEVSATAA